MEGMDIKMADLKNSCDYKIVSVREQCEGQEANYLSLAELMDSKETDLRNEIQDLKTKMADPGKEDTRISDSVLARVENLEILCNSSEKTVAAQCLSVEEKLKVEQAEAIKDLSETLEDKLASMEDRLTTMLVDTSINSPSGGLQSDINSLKGSVQTLEGRFDVLDQMCTKECSANLVL
ncbi:EMILIN-2 Elastin microfibril interface-located protein 2 [Larimichthys crocea]|uniref:EMILIN-2 Elastin microfibril interface-located protein 2 n=1 Tax=Larimichthys crocea TaxID=215358 RepID=A0A6G0HKJ9_LARCR|nr:EMILIN-2 Elastin microfibril interface-located protein 2 [Larimichthys crocea]